MEHDDIIAAAEDPYTWEIARVLRKGQIDALRTEIKKHQHWISTDAWENTENSSGFTRLGDTLGCIERRIEQMRLLLAEIKKLDSTQR